jgi:hypothetical protein
VFGPLSGSRAELAILLAVAVLAAAILLVATERWGLGVSYDSVVYVQASHSLSAVPLPQPRDEGGKPLYWWAPGYPLLLKAFGGSYSGARLLNALLLFTGILVVGGVVWKTVDARSGVVAGVLYGFSPAVFSAHLDLLAEPLFLILATAAVALVAARRPVPAGLAAGLATLTRFAGLPLILTGALVLRGRERAKFLVCSLALYLGWLIRNELVVGQTTGRQVRWHPPTWAALTGGGRALVHLLVTPGQLPSIHLPAGNAGALAELFAAVTLGVGLLRASWSKPPRIVTVGLIYAGIYCVFLVSTVALFDALTPLDERLLVPIVPSLVITVAWLLGTQPVVAATLSCLFVLAVLQQARTVSLYGTDYSGRIWSEARISGTQLPPGDLYSTWPAAIAYFTGRSPHRYPNPVDAQTRARNPRFESEVKQLAAAVQSGKATLITLDETFLEIPATRPPITAEPAFRNTCRLLTKVVFVCTRRRT